MRHPRGRLNSYRTRDGQTYLGVRIREQRAVED